MALGGRLLVGRPLVGALSTQACAGLQRLLGGRWASRPCKATAVTSARRPFPTHQARKAYSPSVLRLNEQFVEMHLEMRGGKLGLDFQHFDDTVAATGARALVVFPAGVAAL